LTVATKRRGGFPHLAFENLCARSAASAHDVPYKGSAAIATDIIGGQVQAGIDGITGMTPHIKSGRLRLLAVTSPAARPRSGRIRPPRRGTSRATSRAAGSLCGAGRHAARHSVLKLIPGDQPRCGQPDVRRESGSLPGLIVVHRVTSEYCSKLLKG